MNGPLKPDVRDFPHPSEAERMSRTGAAMAEAVSRANDARYLNMVDRVVFGEF